MKTIRQLHRAQGAYCSKLLMLCLFIIAGLSDLLAINLPPGDDTDDGCGGSDGTLGSVSFNFDFPILPLEAGLGAQRLSVKRDEPSPSLFTPSSLNYSSGITTFVSSIKAEEQLPAGISHEFELRDENNNAVKYQVSSGSSVARPVGDFTGSDDRVLLLAADYEQIVEVETPVYYRLIKGDGSEIDYAVEVGEFALRVKTPAGRVIEAGEQFDIVLQDGAYRQIRSAAGLVDLLVIDDFSYQLSFYTNASAGVPGADGLYVPVADPEGEPGAEAQPYRTILIRNPTGNPDQYDRIQIVETHGAYERISEWEYIVAAKDWRFMKGLESTTDTQGMLTEQIIVQEDEDTGDVIETRELLDESGELVSSNFERLHTFPWGDDLAIESVKDSMNFALTTTYSYYENENENGFGRRKQTVYPDGRWTHFTYDSEDRMIQRAEPWMDSPVGSPATETKVTIYSYDPVDPRDIATDFDARARTTITQVRGTETGRTYNAYFIDSTINEAGETIYEYTEIEERTTTLEEDGEGPEYGDPSNLRTTRVYYPDNADAVSAGRLQRVTTPDGVVMVYSYAQTTAPDAFVQTVDQLGSNGFVPFKSTRQVTTKDMRGNIVQEASYVRVGSDWQLLSTTTQEFSDEISTKGFQLTKRFKDGRLTLQQGWFGPLVGDRITETGEYYLYDYDLLNRLKFEMKAGVNGAENLVTNYVRDLGAIGCGCDGQASIERTAGGLTLQSSQKTDSAGRRSEATDVNGYTTTYSYVDDRRVTTMESPDGSTRITEKYLDGRIKSVTGTGVVPEYYTYTENADGSITTRVDVATATSPRYRETTVDVAGRLIREESPASDGGMIVRTMEYDAQGLLEMQTETGRAATRYEYDALANLIRSGLDLDGIVGLTLDSSDRITDSNRFMEQVDGDWFAISTTKVYPGTGTESENAVQVSRSAQRLSNFPLAGANGDLVSESATTDVYGNVTANTTYVDRATKTVTQITDSPSSDVDATRISINGLLVSQNSSTVAAATAYGYDALERRVSVKDPRHAQASTIDYYTGTNQVFTQTDGAGNATAYTYYPQGSAGAGQVASVTNALQQKSYQAYDLLGRQIHTWGETDYPQAYSYNAYGELETLTTWRDTEIDFSTTIWPITDEDDSGDETTWSYQASTGLLTRKQYADANGTDYTYDSANRLSVRTWARDGGLDTTYSYDPNTGELLNVNYEAIDTADITYTYDRLGRQATVTDATGIRSFAYDPATLQLEVEELDATFYQDQILLRSVDTFGRPTGYIAGQLKITPVAPLDIQDFDTVYAQSTYGYDTTGRLETITDGTDTFTYSYKPDSNLLASLTAPQHSVAYDYELNRNVMTVVANKVPDLTGVSLSRYGYTYDALGRRADREQSGSAIATTNTDTFRYNTRSEVEGSVNSDTNQGAAWNPDYTYDQIGNRKSSVGFQPATTYASNALNQYVDPVTLESPHDEDGNLETKGLWAYQWNNENRLSSATDGTTNIDFTYDYQGRLVKKDDGTNVEVYVYDGWNRIATYDLQTSNLTLQTSYTWGLDLSGSMQGAGGVGGLLKEGAYYPTYDANGNIMQKLSSTGSVEMNVEYDPFGNIISGSLVGEYGFSTKPLINDIDWYYYGFRYYDPVTGRWPSRDPIGEIGGLNLYGFVRNTPVNLVDTDGRMPFGGDFVNRWKGVETGGGSEGPPESFYGDPSTGEYDGNENAYVGEDGVSYAKRGDSSCRKGYESLVVRIDQFYYIRIKEDEFGVSGGGGKLPNPPGVNPPDDFSGGGGNIKVHPIVESYEYFAKVEYYECIPCDKSLDVNGTEVNEFTLSLLIIIINADVQN